MLWLAPIDQVTMLPIRREEQQDDEDVVDRPGGAAQDGVERELHGVGHAGDDREVLERDGGEDAEVADELGARR